MRVADSFFDGPPLSVARDLLGKLVVRQVADQRLAAIIVEVEAYLASDDPASHSHRGLTGRNSAMFMPAGTLYVYAIHAKYCMNVVTQPAGVGSAVLIRAAQPWQGVERMQMHRGQSSLRELCSGPSKLCQALAIDRQHNQIDLRGSNEVWLEDAPEVVHQMPWQWTSSSRIGISSGQELPYRYFIDGHLCVSGLARLHRQKRNWIFSPHSPPPPP